MASSVRNPDPTLEARRPREHRDGRPASRRARGAPPDPPGSTAPRRSLPATPLAAPWRSCLPNARTMPRFSSVFECFGLIFKRLVELRERAVRLVQIVEADAKVGADVGVRRIDRQCRLVPAGCLLILLGVEIQVAQLDSRRRIGRLGRGTAGGRLDLGVVERRRRGCACRPARRPLAPAPRSRRPGARAIVCCDPMIQPPRNPTSVPAAAKTSDSDFMTGGNLGS